LRQFHLIGVIDLFHGRAVHARGGRRAEYRPVEAAAEASIGGDPRALARFYQQRGLDQVYVADLDAIGSNAPQHTVIESIAQLGVTIWLDAGIASVAQAQDAIVWGAGRVIVGLETLQSLEQLRDIRSAIETERLAFSLDLRGGVPIIAADAAIPMRSPAELAVAVADAGVNALIVLDLERVGASVGLDMTLLARIRDAVPDVTLLAGGGVRGPDDLSRLASAGCDGALIATALHKGTIDPRRWRLPASS